MKGECLALTADCWLLAANCEWEGARNCLFVCLFVFPPAAHTRWTLLLEGRPLGPVSLSLSLSVSVSIECVQLTRRFQSIFHSQMGGHKAAAHTSKWPTQSQHSGEEEATKAKAKYPPTTASRPLSSAQLSSATLANCKLNGSKELN